MIKHNQKISFRIFSLTSGEVKVTISGNTDVTISGGPEHIDGLRYIYFNDDDFGRRAILES